MKIKSETNEKILLENGGRFYALYNIYERELKLIDAETDQAKIVGENLGIQDAFGKLNSLKKKDMVKEFNRSQSKLFFLEGDTDG